MLFLTNLAYSQPNSYVQFSVKEGLPQSQVFALLQDHHEYLWLGTQGGGLSRFDGQKFEPFTSSQGLPANNIHALYQAKDKKIWIGTSQGIVYYDGRKFNSTNSSALTSIRINTFWEDNEAQIWVGTNAGVFLWDKKENAFAPSEKYKDLKSHEILAFHQTQKGLWVGTNRGAFFFGKENYKVSKTDGLPNDYVSSFAHDRAGALWIGTNAGAAILNENDKSMSLPSSKAAFLSTTCILNDVNGNVWIGTAHDGLIVHNQSSQKATIINEKTGFPHNNIKGLVEDKTGNIWVATSGGGLVKITSQAFRTYDTADGLIGNRIYAIAQDQEGRIVFSASQNGIQTLDSSGLNTPSVNIQDIDVKCKALCIDQQNRIWAGTEGQGIAILQHDKRILLTQDNGLPSNWIQSIALGRNGEIWVATFSNGLAKIVSKDSSTFSIQKFGTGEGLIDTRITTMLLDKNGSVWASTPSGYIFRIQNGKVNLTLDKANGLPKSAIRSMAFDDKGQLWVAITDKGLYKAKLNERSTQFSSVQPIKPLRSQNIYLMAFDSLGNLWTGSESGVDEWTPLEQNQPLFVQHYGKNEGFTGIETCHNAVLLDKSGNLWFGTINGLTFHHAGRQTVKYSAPTLHLEDITLFYNSLRQTEYAALLTSDGQLLPGLSLRYKENHLSFGFKAIDLNHPESIKYRWKLKGFQDEWSPFSSQSKVDYTNLPPGEYTLLVQACTDESMLSTPLSLPFAIQKPFWQFWWFRILACCLLGAIGYGLIKFRIEQVKKAEAQKRSALEVKNHLLQLEQKALQLQMNPHFIFNALNSVQALIVNEKYDSARQEINNFARLIRSILSNSRRESISLEEEVQTLTQYLSIEQFCQKNEFAFEINIQDGLNPEDIELPPMLLQPFVENAVIHGVSHLKYPGKISIHIGSEQELLVITIRDNGVGREKAAQLQQARQSGHQSAATQVTKERLEALKGEQPYECMDIRDIYSEKGELAGTEVIVRLPCKRTY